VTPEEAKAYLLRRARERGVQVEVLGVWDRELGFRVREGSVEQVTRADRGGVGVRVVIRERAGYAYTEQLTPEALEWILREAEENASLQREAVAFLPEGRALGHHDLLGEGLAASADSKLALALEVDRAVRAQESVRRVTAAWYHEREHHVHLGSTEGAEGSYRTGVASLGVGLVAQAGASLKQGYHADWQVSFAALDPGRTALEAARRTTRLLGARRLPTGRYPALFEPRAFAQLLGAFWVLWSGKAVAEGKSRLRGRLGEQVASEPVTLVDDPTLAAGLQSRPFDAEGTPARRTVLVERGVLRSYLTHSQSAQALEHPNTGHAWRSYRGVLEVAPTNLHLEPGEGASLERGVVVAELMGVHAGCNPVSGQFSLQALGLWVEGGEVAHPVEDFAVCGDFLELLRRVVALGDRLEWEPVPGAVVGTPTVLVEDLSFAGS
jgi:PmbA protein